MASPAPAGAAGLPAPASLSSLPTHLAVCVLAFLDLPSLLSVSRTCRGLFAAACDERLWADGALQRRAPLHARPRGPRRVQASVANALADALGAALALPPPLLRRRLSLEPLSSFQASLSLGGLHAALELVGTNEAGSAAAATQTRAATKQKHASVAMSAPADRWLLGLLASPAAALAAVSAAAARAPCARDDLGAALAEGASRARAAVLCARLERSAVRLQLAPRFAAAAALRAAAAQRVAADPHGAARADDHPDADADADAADAVARLRFWARQHDADVADAARALAATTLPPGHALRAAVAAALGTGADDADAEVDAENAIEAAAATACLSDVELSLRLDAALHAPWGDAGAAAAAVRALARCVGGAAAAAAPRADGGGALALGAPPPPPLSAARAALLDAALRTLQRLERDRAAAAAEAAQGLAAAAAAAAVATTHHDDDADMCCG
jgi:hypothetical protein